jgi:hypothetical protein
MYTQTGDQTVWFFFKSPQVPNWARSLLKYVQAVLKYVTYTTYRRTSAVGHCQQHCYHHVPTVNQRLLLQLIGS